jgi:hypothetical protein
MIKGSHSVISGVGLSEHSHGKLDVHPVPAAAVELGLGSEGATHESCDVVYTGELTLTYLL